MGLSNVYLRVKIQAWYSAPFVGEIQRDIFILSDCGFYSKNFLLQLFLKTVIFEYI